MGHPIGIEGEDAKGYGHVNSRTGWLNLSSDFDCWFNVQMTRHPLHNFALENDSLEICM